MTDDERRQYEAQVADLAAKVACLDPHAVIEQERRDLRKLAWDSAVIAQQERGALELWVGMLRDHVYELECALYRQRCAQSEEDSLEILALRRLAWDSAEIAARQYAEVVELGQRCIDDAEQERDTARWDDAERGELLLRIERLTQERDKALKAVEGFLYSPPAKMTSPLGLLPVNSDGMRTLVDRVVELERERDAALQERDALIEAHVAEGVAQAKRGELTDIPDLWSEEEADSIELERIAAYCEEQGSPRGIADGSVLAQVMVLVGRAICAEQERDQLRWDLERALACVVMP